MIQGLYIIFHNTDCHLKLYSTVTQISVLIIFKNKRTNRVNEIVSFFQKKKKLFHLKEFYFHLQDAVTQELQEKWAKDNTNGVFIQEFKGR